MMGTILLIDENSLQAANLLAQLGTRFASVTRAPNAAEALCLIEQPELAQNLSLIVLSLPVSGIGCVDLTTELRVRLPQTPILVINGQPQSATKFQHLNVQFYPAPVVSETLIALIAEYLEMPHAS